MTTRHARAEEALAGRGPSVATHPSRKLGLALLAPFVLLGLALTTMSYCYNNTTEESLYDCTTTFGLGIVLMLLTLALGARLCAVAKDASTAICALCGGAVAIFGAWGFCYQLPLYGVASVAVFGTGLAVIGRALAADRLWPTAILLNNCIVSGGFSFVWLLHWTNGSSGDLVELFPPLAATLITACNAGFLFIDLDQPVMRTFSAASPAGLSVRRIFTCSLITLMSIGVLRTLLQTWGLVKLEEGTGLMVLSAIVVTGVILCRSAKLLNEAWEAEERVMQFMRQEAYERQAVVQQLDTERNQLAAVLRAAGDYAIIAADLSGKIIIFNEGASRLLGYTAEEMVDTDVLVRVHDPDEVIARARALNIPPGFGVFSALPSEGKTDARQWTYVRKDGRRLQVWLSVTAMRDRNDAISGYVGISRDISAEVRHKREREGLLKIGQELLCLADAQGFLKVTSPSFLRISGYSAQDLIDHQLTDFIHPDDRSKTADMLKQLLTAGAVQRFESRWRRRDGCYRIISWDISPPESDGFMFASGWDITEEKAHQQELERFLEFEKQLIGIVSHDLRNPIAASSLAAQAIARQKDASEKIRNHAQRIYLSSERATRMIHDLLDFTQARLGGGLRVDRHELDLAPAIGQILDELRLAHPKHRIVLECPEHLMLEGDADRLAQALSNIVGNSLKYGSSDDPVIVSAHRTGDKVALAVHNSGVPIAADVIPTLFMPLRRGASSKSNSGHSIGLGLYIASEIARAHGGCIDVQSSAEEGTTFTIRLPVGHAVASVQASEQASIQAEANASPVPTVVAARENEANSP